MGHRMKHTNREFQTNPHSLTHTHKHTCNRTYTDPIALACNFIYSFYYDYHSAVAAASPKVILLSCVEWFSHSVSSLHIVIVLYFFRFMIPAARAKSFRQRATYILINDWRSECTDEHLSHVLSPFFFFLCGRRNDHWPHKRLKNENKEQNAMGWICEWKCMFGKLKWIQWTQIVDVNARGWENDRVVMLARPTLNFVFTFRCTTRGAIVICSSFTHIFTLES